MYIHYASRNNNHESYEMMEARDNRYRFEDMCYEKITDKNFDITPLIYAEENTQYPLEFSGKEIDILETKFTYKTNNIDKRYYGQEMNVGIHYEFVKKCSICYIDFLNEDFTIDLPGCRHTFHWGCIKVWLEKSPTCPECRTNVRVCMIKI